MCHPWAPMPSFTVPSPNALMVRPERSLFAKDSAMSSLFSTPGPIMLNSCSLVSRYWVKVVGGGDICGEGVIVGGLAIRLVEVRKHDRSQPWHHQLLSSFVQVLPHHSLIALYLLEYKET